MTDSKKKATDKEHSTPGGPRIHWDNSELSSTYSNVCNVTSTREEVVLNFGVNQAWERSQNDFEIKLTNRQILNPFAAKRLSLMLIKLMGEYEDRYGEVKLDLPAPAGQTKVN